MLTYGPRCLALVEHYEGLELEAYPDPFSRLGRACTLRGLPMREYRKVGGWEDVDGSPWTIGRGWTHGVKPGDVCTEDQADEWLKTGLTHAALEVQKSVRIELTQNQLDALTSLVYNIGQIQPTLFSMLNNGLIQGAADQFCRWNHANGVVSEGLTARRFSERALFLGLPVDIFGNASVPLSS